NIECIQESNDLRRNAGDLRDALENHQRALTLLQQIADATPSDLASKSDLVMAHVAVGDDLVKAGDRDQALDYYRRARNLLEPLVQNNSNTLFRRSLAICYTRTGDALLMNGKAAEALRYYRGEFQLLQPTALADPKDIDAQSIFITSAVDVGHALVEAGRVKEGLAFLLRAIGQQAALATPAHDPPSRKLLASP